MYWWLALTVALLSGIDAAALDATRAGPTPQEAVAHIEVSGLAIATHINITWNSRLHNSDLEVWQGPNANGSWAWKVLASHLPPTCTTYEWAANGIDSSVEDEPFYFVLRESTKTQGSDASEPRPAFSNTPPNVPILATMHARSEMTMPTWIDPIDQPSPKPTKKHRMDIAIGFGLGIAGVILIVFLILTLATFMGKRAANKGECVEMLMVRGGHGVAKVYNKGRA